MTTPKLWTFEVKTNHSEGWDNFYPNPDHRVIDSYRTFDLDIRHSGELVLGFKGATEMEMWADGVKELCEALLKANGEGGVER